MTNFSKLSSSMFAIAIALLLAGTASAQQCVSRDSCPGSQVCCIAITSGGGVGNSGVCIDAAKCVNGSCNDSNGGDEGSTCDA
ncbi:hypothetical protein R3P38DRAFT_2957776 [Favolaschia claudopus]|uniref:Uncharacterized protein n=1 Tax=Favolaschia claudopus TaxID=2862362 RepID=A0AAW0BAM0_9AGAR